MSEINKNLIDNESQQFNKKDFVELNFYKSLIAIERKNVTYFAFPKFSPFSGYSWNWPSDWVKQDKHNKDRICIYVKKDHEITITKVIRDEDSKQWVVADKLKLTPDRIQEAMTKEPKSKNSLAIRNRIIFLDYDGVVNTEWWHKNYYGELVSSYNLPLDNAVNNDQAIAWLNHLYRLYPYDIVVTSSWREEKNYKDCLYNAGLHGDIRIIGATESFSNDRGKEILSWIEKNNYKGKYAILDDEAYYYTLKNGLIEHYVYCDSNYGFLKPEYEKVIDIFANEE